MTDKVETDEPRDFIASELILDKLNAIKDKLDGIKDQINVQTGHLEAIQSTLEDGR